MRYAWFRLYNETIYDPKIRRLPVLVRWVWITILCLASASTRRGWIFGFDAKSLSDAAGLDGVPEQDVKKAVDLLVSMQMLRDTRRGWRVINFEARQYDKPSARPQRVNQRVVKHRRNALVTPMKHPVTPRGEERREEKSRRESTTTSVVMEKVLWTGTTFQYTEAQLTRWKEAYPAIDVIQVLHLAAEWVIANPKNHKKNWQRFVVNWLARAQEKAPRTVRDSSVSSPRFDGPVVPSAAETHVMLQKIRGVMRDL